MNFPLGILFPPAGGRLDEAIPREAQIQWTIDDDSSGTFEYFRIFKIFVSEIHPNVFEQNGENPMIKLERARARARASRESKLALSVAIRNEELHDWSDLRQRCSRTSRKLTPVILSYKMVISLHSLLVALIALNHYSIFGRKGEGRVNR